MNIQSLMLLVYLFHTLRYLHVGLKVQISLCLHHAPSTVSSHNSETVSDLFFEFGIDVYQGTMHKKFLFDWMVLMVP